MNDQRSSIGFNLDHVRPRGHYENVTYEAEAPEKAAKLKAIIAELETLDPDIEIPESWQDDIKRWGGGTFKEYVSDMLRLPTFTDFDPSKPVVWAMLLYPHLGQRARSVSMLRPVISCTRTIPDTADNPVRTGVIA